MTVTGESVKFHPIEIYGTQEVLLSDAAAVSLGSTSKQLCEEIRKTMPKTQYTKTALKEAIAGKLQRHFACEVEDATKDLSLIQI